MPRLPLLLLISLALLTASPSGARADSTTFNFSGEVSMIFPVGSETIDDEFTLGETVNISLTYDPDTPENAASIGDPGSALYSDPLISFSINFVDSGRDFDMTGGALQVVNVVNDLDGGGVFVDIVGTAAQQTVGGSIIGSINGETPTIVSLSIQDFEFSPDLPDMLSSIELPSQPFVPREAIAIFSLSAGENVTLTINNFVPEPGDTDNDGAPDDVDNCPYFTNVLQRDTNDDGIGDLCQCGDATDDGAITGLDIGGAALCANGRIACDPGLVDSDGDGTTTALDIGGIHAVVNGDMPTTALQCQRAAGL